MASLSASKRKVAARLLVEAAPTPADCRFGPNGAAANGLRMRAFPQLPHRMRSVIALAAASPAAAFASAIIDPREQP